MRHIIESLGKPTSINIRIPFVLSSFGGPYPKCQFSSNVGQKEKSTLHDVRTSTQTDEPKRTTQRQSLEYKKSIFIFTVQVIPLNRVGCGNNKRRSQGGNN